MGFSQFLTRITRIIRTTTGIMSVATACRVLARNTLVSGQRRGMANAIARQPWDKSKVYPPSLKLKETQAKFKENLHLPVHMKGGYRDKVMFYGTSALAWFCLLTSVTYIYEKLCFSFTSTDCAFPC